MPKKEATISGTILALNISPRGNVEGLLVETSDGVAQVNVPKEGAPELALRAGEHVALRCEPEHDDGDHPVYRWLDDAAEVTGTVTSFNYARHGEVNGVRLDDGTFVHLKPEGAKEHELEVGEHIWVRGRRKIGSDAVVIDAEKVERRSQRSSTSTSKRSRGSVAV